MKDLSVFDLNIGFESCIQEGLSRRVSRISPGSLPGLANKNGVRHRENYKKNNEQYIIGFS